MTINIDVDNQTVADLNEALRILKQDQNEAYRQAIIDLAKKKKREAELAKQYLDAYTKDPIRPDEFEIEEEQLIEAWKDL